MGYPKISRADSSTSLVVPAKADTIAAGRWPMKIKTTGNNFRTQNLIGMK